MSGIDGGLRPLFRQHIQRVQWTSIETGSTGRGIPDSNMCGPREAPCPSCGSRGYDVWIEYKTTGGHAVTLRPEQIGWLCARHRHGGRAFVAVRRVCGEGPRRQEADELWLCDGQYAKELKTYGLPQKNYPERLPRGAVLGCWPGGPSRWDWSAVRRLLTS